MKQAYKRKKYCYNFIKIINVKFSQTSFKSKKNIKFEFDKLENLIKKRIKRAKRANVFIIFDAKRTNTKRQTRINI